MCVGSPMPDCALLLGETKHSNSGKFENFLVKQVFLFSVISFSPSV